MALFLVNDDAADTAQDLVELGAHTVVVADAVMRDVYARARRLARADVPVAIQGETGTGKELVALALHVFSARAGGPFVAINCAAIPESLAEAELFGHARGAFTGAIAPRAGQLEEASGGTLFLDEVADLSLAMQARLLRALECGEVRRLGESAARRIDVRVVCASHRRLRDEVAAGRFREDLYYRLGVAQLELPPLRERPRDLAALSARFVEGACARMGRRPLRLSAATTRALEVRRWSGNVRELRHVLECAVALTDDDARELAPWHLPAELTQAGATDATAARTAGTATAAPGGSFRPITEELEELERRRMIEALRASDGVHVHAARLIAMPGRTFATKLRRYAIGDGEWKTT
ncbi:MAG TPA: sigma-54 dependent transcriptional regulator [Kofleriaceae bacterium]|nr:sigma-54 dependent transcriptional regulator [Kofleriaceae bacterium]